jgi:pilus assembly protein Flp/PilA
VELIKRLWKDEEGPTAVEYALLAALIAAAIVTAAGTLGTNIAGRFTSVAASVKGP